MDVIWILFPHGGVVGLFCEYLMRLPEGYLSERGTTHLIKPVRDDQIETFLCGSDSTSTYSESDQL